MIFGVICLAGLRGAQIKRFRGGGWSYLWDQPNTTDICCVSIPLNPTNCPAGLGG